MVGAMEGRWAEAVEHWGAAREAALKAGDSVTVASTAMSLGEMFVKQGLADEAEPLLNEAIRVLRAIHHVDLKAYAEIQLARVWVQRRAVAEAVRLSDLAREQLEALGKRMYSLEAATVQGLARVIGGEPEVTFALIEQAASKAGDAASGLVPMAAHAKACALLALGRLADAEHEIGIGLQAARELGFPYEEAQLLFLRSEGARRSGRDPSPGDEARSAEILKALDVRLDAMTTGWPPSRHADR
jgi:tetratricopeptide (TPR) repeat protein